MEENPWWCENEWAVVDQSPNVDAALIPASIRLTVDRRGIHYGYEQVAEIAARGPYDLVFVDAPWGGYGRDGGGHAAFASVRPGFLIVLDDARRPWEQRTVRRWLPNYPELSLVANDAGSGRGLAVLRKDAITPSSPGRDRAAVRAWWSGISEVVRGARGVRRHERNVAALKAGGSRHEVAGTDG